MAYIDHNQAPIKADNCVMIGLRFFASSSLILKAFRSFRKVIA